VLCLSKDIVTIDPQHVQLFLRGPLLRSAVDINTIRAWLGHVSLETTNICAEGDLERKTSALTQCNALQATYRSRKRWRDDPSLIAFLRAL
jgi:integrase/recombinase XerD